MSDFGSSLFKVQGGSATYADIIAVLKAIVEEESARTRCSALSNLVSTLPEAKRTENCESMINLFFANFRPPEEEEKATKLPYEAQPEFLGLCPVPYSKWTAHVPAKRDQNRNVLSAELSRYVGDRIAALESLWGLSGRYVRKR